MACSVGMEPGFSGETAAYYHQYRRGYPAAVLAAIAASGR